MTAPFAAELCGYRPKNGQPNTSDASDASSVKWGNALFARLGIPASRVAPSTQIGNDLEQRASEHLSRIRADLVFARSAPIAHFEQYLHLAAFQQFQGGYKTPGPELAMALANAETQPGTEWKTLAKLLRAADRDSTTNQVVVDRLRRAMAQESVLQLDLTVSDAANPPRLLIGLSSKWTLRTDRAQDCVAQGQKLSVLRRGHMPHFAVLTIEPRPVMLRLLAYGSGAVDCVYHIALPELLLAAQDLVADATSRTRRSAQDQRETLELMVEQRRIRPFSDLVAEVGRLGV